MSKHPLAVSVPPISEELFNLLDKDVYREIRPEPNVTSIEEIWYNAGARAVIQTLSNYRREMILTGSR